MPENDCRNAALSNDYRDFLIAPEFLEEYAYEPQYCVQLIGRTAACIYLPVTDFPTLSMQTTEYTAIPKLYGLMEGEPSDQVRSIALQQEDYMELDGEGVLLGFIGTGINYESNYFKNSDGSTRIIELWDQTIQTGQPPTGITYGSVYTQDMINQALASDNPLSIVPSQDTIGNGTYLASVAAASENESGSFRGVAPRASIAVVKLKEAKPYLRDYYAIKNDAHAYQENDIMLAIRYLRDLAYTMSMPLVICLGLGTSIGNHDNSSFLTQYIDEISIGYRCVVAGTGNEANQRHHFQGSFNLSNSSQISNLTSNIPPGTQNFPTRENYIDVEVRVEDNSRGFWMELWGRAPDVYSIAVISPSGETLQRVPYRIDTGIDYRFIFEGSEISISYHIMGEYLGDPLILIRMTAPANGIWTFRIYGTNLTYGTFHMWLPISEFIEGQTYFLTSNPEMTLTEPSTSERAISVSAYDTQNNSIFLESGRGYTFTNLIKPYFAAPGVAIPGINLRDNITRRSGTGGSAALTAGSCALIFQWTSVLGNDPDIGIIRLSTLLIRGADRSPARTYPNREWGFGALDLNNTFENFRPI